MPRKYDEDLSKFLSLPNMNNIFVKHNGHKLSIAQHYNDDYTKPIVREIYSAYLDSGRYAHQHTHPMLKGDGIVHYDQTLDGLIEALQKVKSRIEKGE